MADFRKETHGAGSLKSVDLVVMSYDGRHAPKPVNGVQAPITTRYIDARIHPDDRRAAGQTTLALVAKRDPSAPSGYNNAERYSENQFQAIVEAAGDNRSDLLNKEGVKVGDVYGVKADLLLNNGSAIINTKSVVASELSVTPDADGKNIQQRMFETMAATKAAREAEKSAAKDVAAPEAAAAAETEAPEVAAEEKPAAKTATKKAPAKRASRAKVKPELAPEPEVAEASADEPGLG